MVISVGCLRRRSKGQARVDRLACPGAADPCVGRVVAEPPGPDRLGARHDVEVVQGVAGPGDRRPVPAVRDQDHVARAHLGQHVDRAGGRAVDPLVGEALGLEVVDLLEFGLVLARLVVLVRRVGGPVPARGEHLDRDELVAVERPGRAEVVDLAAGLAGPAQFHRHVLGGTIPGFEPARAAGARDGERAAVPAGHGDGGVARRVAEVADPGEDAAPALQLEGRAVARHGGRPGQRQDQDLVLLRWPRCASRRAAGSAPSGRCRSSRPVRGSPRGRRRRSVLVPCLR